MYTSPIRQQQQGHKKLTNMRPQVLHAEHLDCRIGADLAHDMRSVAVDQMRFLYYIAATLALARSDLLLASHLQV